MHGIEPVQILVLVFEAIFVLLLVICKIKQHRYIETEAEIIGYRADRTGASYRDIGIPFKIVTYRYHLNGIKYTESESVCISKKTLARVKMCSIYVNPRNSRKFVTQFQISMWQTYTLIGSVFVVLSIPMYII